MFLKKGKRKMIVVVMILDGLERMAERLLKAPDNSVREGERSD